MKVITLREPWATLAACGRKPWENRKGTVAAVARTLVGQRVAIHAGLEVDPEVHQKPKAPDGLPWPKALHHGMIIGAVTIVAVCEPGQEPHPYRDLRRHGIRLRDARMLTPRPWVGKQGWRDLPAELVAAIEADDAELDEPALRRLVEELRLCAQELRIALGQMEPGKRRWVARGHVTDAEQRLRTCVERIERHRRAQWTQHDKRTP